MNLQKCVELAETVCGKNHGFRFVQVPMSTLMPEAFVEIWQEFAEPGVANAEMKLKPLVNVCNVLKMNVIASKPLAESRVRDVDIPNIKNISVIVAKHLQLIRSLPPRCLISTMCGMKTLSNVKTNYREVLSREPLTIPEFLKAMEE